MMSEVRVLECRRELREVEASFSLRRLGACSMLPHRLEFVDGHRVKLLKSSSADSPGAM